MNTAREFEDENGATIFVQVREVVDNLDEFLPEPAPISYRVARKYLLNLLSATQGEQWRRCQVIEFTMPDGTRAFTASIPCFRCGTHVWLATLNSRNEFVFAAPLGM